MIEEIQFGKIKINGILIEHDVVITPSGEVVDRRKRLSTRSHEIEKEEIVRLLEEDPEVIIIGAGMMNRVQVTDEARELIREKGILLYIHNSREAIRKFNEMREEGKKVGAIIHITC